MRPMAFVAVVSLASVPATAQFTCKLRTTNEWLKRGDSLGPVKQLREDRVRAVSGHQAEAITRLEKRSAEPLTEAEVRKFTGKPSGPSDSAFHPYLVRGVFPTGKPALDVRWDGRRLDVFAGGLGCAAYSKHPIVVFLERRPAEVNVMASAAL